MTKAFRSAKDLITLSPVSLLSFLPWLALLGWLSSVAWFLCDDAFISFRYTRNLLEGHGLVFNPGEYVEGYTNFLWILELAAIWGIFGLRPEHVAPWLSVAYTIGTIAAMMWWVVRLPSLRNRGLVGWMALGLLCSSATFAVWTSGGGLETRQFTFFIVAAVVCLSLYANSRAGLLTASFSLAAAELTRPEGLLLAACCFAWFAVQRLVREERVNARLLRQLVYLVAPFLILVAAHFLFRYAYYGEWLPNTYYAKHVRPWYESGFRYLTAAALETGLYLLLALALLARRSRWQTHRDGSFALPLLCVAAHMAYLLPIGGDHFEFRPLDFYWPLLTVPAAEGIALLGSGISTGLRKLPRVPRWTTGGRPYTIALFLPVLFYANAIQGFLLFEDAAIRKQNGLWYAELNQENAGWLLAAPGVPALVAISNDLRRQYGVNMVGIRFSEHRNFVNTITLVWKPYEQMERGFFPDDALAFGRSLGRFYFLPDLKIFDHWGLTDATVARTPVTHSNRERQLAHDRQPTPEYLKQRAVNFRVSAPVSSATVALTVADYAVKVGPDLWMPFNTVNGQWAATRFAGRDLRAFATQLEPLTVNYDGGIALQGIALGHGNEQLPSRPLLLLETERSLRGVLQWRIDPGLDIEYAISLRLYNADGQVTFQTDDLIRHPTIGTTTTHWPGNEPVDTQFRIEIPADLPTGQYELRQVVYNFETGTPTVQQGTWQPVITLARLRLAEAR